MSAISFLNMSKASCLACDSSVRTHTHTHTHTHTCTKDFLQSSIQPDTYEYTFLCVCRVCGHITVPALSAALLAVIIPDNGGVSSRVEAEGDVRLVLVSHS